MGMGVKVGVKPFVTFSQEEETGRVFYNSSEEDPETISMRELGRKRECMCVCGLCRLSTCLLDFQQEEMSER
jgi:hypothetical protein